jgi:hypothetical protein
MQSVKQAILDFYAKNHADAPKDLVQKGAEAASEVFGRNVFPEMNTNWETHPNHIGHPNPDTDEGFAGCWRCHDDKLSTADGEHTIPQDCDNCHVFLAEGTDNPPDFAAQ